MNSKKAKSLRNRIYGSDSKRFRSYSVLSNGVIVADEKRRLYKKSKNEKPNS